MKNSIVTIIENKQIADGIFEMKLQMPQGEQAEIKPGQFINIKLAGEYLRRPISICDWSDDTLTIIYKVVGKGTKKMSTLRAEEILDILWPLGNGFTTKPSESGQPQDTEGSTSESQPILMGGGVGVPPMYGLCKRLVEEGQTPTVILGFRSSTDIFYKDQFEALGVKTIVTTEDGSAGTKGFVTDALAELTVALEETELTASAEQNAKPATIYACGPEAMLRAIDQTAPAHIVGQFSFEERMGCGFGACMGCSCKTKYGSKRICKDGPVLERSEIIW